MFISLFVCLYIESKEKSLLGFRSFMFPSRLLCQFVHLVVARNANMCLTNLTLVYWVPTRFHGQAKSGMHLTQYSGLSIRTHYISLFYEIELWVESVQSTELPENEHTAVLYIQHGYSMNVHPWDTVSSYCSDQMLHVSFTSMSSQIAAVRMPEFKLVNLT